MSRFNPTVGEILDIAPHLKFRYVNGVYLHGDKQIHDIRINVLNELELIYSENESILVAKISKEV